MRIVDKWARENIAWAAGVFEGEGCIKLIPVSDPNRIALSLVMTDADVVYRFHSTLGLGFVGKPTVRGCHKPYWTWTCTRGEHVQAILAAFWEFLGERRKLKAEKVIRFYSAMRQHSGARRFCPHGHEYTEDNTYIWSGFGDKKYRACKKCRKIYDKNRKQRLKIARRIKNVGVYISAR